MTLKRNLSIGLLVLFVPGLVSAQIKTPESTAAAPTTDALVYVQTTKGVQVYNFTSAGKLTQAAGTGQVSGEMIGSNGKYFVSLGTDYIHSYYLNSSGMITSQASQLNTQSYAGSECGTTGGATLDQSGQYVYVNLSNAIAGGGEVCTAYQTIKLNPGTGKLTFNGSTQGNSSTVTILADEKFAYSVNDGGYTNDFYALSRDSAGMLNFISIGETDLAPQPDYGFFPTTIITTDGLMITGYFAGLAEDDSKHLAAALSDMYETPFNPSNPPQLASYTVNSSGGIISTNNYADMPTPSMGVTTMNMNPSGNILAVGGPGGLQLYHFNGASPITYFTAPITKDPINAINWDNHGHLFATSYKTGKVYIWSVTTTGVSNVGLPIQLSGVTGMVVAAK